MDKFKIIAMIPARMGSTRIPKKNLRLLADKPLIQYPIDLCLEYGGFDSVWFNTESEELGELAQSMGAQFHRRPLELSSDKATNRDFVYEFLKKHECDYVVMVNTTSPLLSQETLTNFISFISNNDFDTVLSVVNEKTECFYKNQPVNFPISEKINSQFLEPVGRTVWAMTAWKRDTFIKLQENKENPVFGGKLGLFDIPKDESCDLDTEEDWNIAEGMVLSKKIKMTPRYYSL